MGVFFFARGIEWGQSQVVRGGHRKSFFVTQRRDFISDKDNLLTTILLC